MGQGRRAMRIAIVHDYIKEYGGAERVLEALHELYPDAPVYTTVYLPQFLGPHRERFRDWTIRTSWLQKLPLKEKLISPFRVLAPFVFRSFDFSSYDVIIVSATGAYFPNAIEKKKARQICYCHTPPRYLYGYMTARAWKKNTLVKTVSIVVFHVLRMVDFNASKNVDFYIANSDEVRGRIQKFYRKDATVIYPSVDVQNQESRIKNHAERLYFLAGGRLARPKHIDLIVKACKELKLPLKVFGKGFAGYGDELRAMAGPDTEFVGEVTDEEKYALMAGAKAFLFAGEDEDFGIVPVEAMAVGTPVVAYRSGGVKETVVDGKTGIFFDELTVLSLKDAIRRFEKTKFDQTTLRKHAERFGKERFKREIDGFIRKHSDL